MYNEILPAFLSYPPKEQVRTVLSIVALGFSGSSSSFYLPFLSIYFHLKFLLTIELGLLVSVAWLWT